MLFCTQAQAFKRCGFIYKVERRYYQKLYDVLTLVLDPLDFKLMRKIRLIFVFNGMPPLFKKEEIEKRRRAKEKYTKEYKEAVVEGDRERAMRKQVMTSRLTFPMVEDAKRLLQLLGIPYVQLPKIIV